MLNWQATGHGIEQGVTLEWLGLIPAFIMADDPTPVAEQVDANYQHGGGWRPLSGWKMDEDYVLTYGKQEPDEDGLPPDPPLKPLFQAEHDRGGGVMEKVFFYDSAWVNVVQEDGTFEVSRMD